MTQFHVVPNQRDENMQIEAAESENLGAIMETDSDGNRNNRLVMFQNFRSSRSYLITQFVDYVIFKMFTEMFCKIVN